MDLQTSYPVAEERTYCTSILCLLGAVVEQGDLKEAELSKRQVADSRRDMLKHTADLSLVAAGKFLGIFWEYFLSGADSPQVLRVGMRKSHPRMLEQWNTPHLSSFAMIRF